MPRPVYVICSENLAEDKTTNQVSLFSMVERIQIFKVTKPEAESSPPEKQEYINVNLKALAVWMKEPEDHSSVFEHQFLLRHSAENEFEIGEPAKYTFADDKSLQRFKLNISTFPLVEKTGIFEICSRVRSIGESSWSEQSYPMSFEYSQGSSES